jgi:putative membrane protein
MKKELALLASLCLLVIGSITVPVQAADNSLSPAGKLFIKDAASSGMMEVKLGQVAHDKGKSQEVKDFGDHMVVDHLKVNDELKEIAEQKNLKLPVQVERKHKQMIARLAKLSGSEFDRKYMQTMVKNHLKNIALFKKAVKKVKDQDLNAWAVNTLPVLEQHLELAKEVAQNLGQPSK